MAAEFIGMCRTIVYQQQSFRRTDVLQMLMAFNCWYEFFRKPLGKNFRIHPRTSLRVIDHRECIHSYVFEDLGFADFPMRTGFSLWVPVAFMQPSTVKWSFWTQEWISHDMRQEFLVVNTTKRNVSLSHEEAGLKLVFQATSAEWTRCTRPDTTARHSQASATLASILLDVVGEFQDLVLVLVYVYIGDLLLADAKLKC